MDPVENIKTAIRDVPDFPKPGILFKDITPLLNNARLFSSTLDILAEKAHRYEPDVIVGIESRGFIFGAALADRLNCGFVPVRKPGKLPYKTFSEEYALEYGTDTVEMHVDALKEHKRALIVDDLLATGGTALATAHLVEKGGGSVQALFFVIELEFLQGRKKLSNYTTLSLIKY